MTATIASTPVNTLRTAAERLWAHGESPAPHIIPKALCFALSNQFDVAVDEWRYGEKGMENLDRNLALAECALQTLDG